MISAPYPDLERITQVVEQHDALAKVIAADLADQPDRAEAHSCTARLAEGLVDYESLFIASSNRANVAMGEIHPLQFLAHPHAAWAACWADGFLAGIRFAKEGS